MKQLLDLIKKDTSRWECHPLLEDLFNDFKIGGFVRKYWPETNELLSFGNDLMRVKIWLQRDSKTHTWSLSGKLTHRFSIFRTTDWPEPLAQHYVSSHLAASDLESSFRTAWGAAAEICGDLFGIAGDRGWFTTGQYLSVLNGDVVVSGNYYPRVMPPRLTTRLFRSDLAIACVWLFHAYVGYYSGMLPRPVSSKELDVPLRAVVSTLFTPEPRQMLDRRAARTDEAHEKVVAKAHEGPKSGDGKTPPPPFEVDDDLEDEVVQSVESSLEKGDTVAAETQIREHLAKYPQSTLCRYRLARIFLWTGRPEQAVLEFRRLADIYLEVGWLWNAFDTLERLETITPDDPFLYFRKAFIYDRSEYFRSAARELQKAGEILLRKGDTAGLEQFRERMIGLWVNRLPSMENLSAAAMLRLDFSRDFNTDNYYRKWIPAKPSLKKSISVAKSKKILVSLDELRTLRATKKLARRYERKGQVQKGAEIYVRLAKIYEGYNLQTNAIRVYESAAAANPEWVPTCLNRVAQLYRERYRHHLAANTYRKLAQYYRDRDEQNKAEEAARNADDIDPDIARGGEFEFNFDSEAPFNFDEPNFGESAKTPEAIVKFEDNDQELDFSTLESG